MCQGNQKGILACNLHGVDCKMHSNLPYKQRAAGIVRAARFFSRFSLAYFAAEAEAFLRWPSNHSTN